MPFPGQRIERPDARLRLAARLSRQPFEIERPAAAARRGATPPAATRRLPTSRTAATADFRLKVVGEGIREQATPVPGARRGVSPARGAPPLQERRRARAGGTRGAGRIPAASRPASARAGRPARRFARKARRLAHRAIASVAATTPRGPERRAVRAVVPGAGTRLQPRHVHVGRALGLARLAFQAEVEHREQRGIGQALRARAGR